MTLETALEGQERRARAANLMVIGVPESQEPVADTVSRLLPDVPQARIVDSGSLGRVRGETGSSRDRGDLRRPDLPFAIRRVCQIRSLIHYTDTVLPVLKAHVGKCGSWGRRP